MEEEYKNIKKEIKDIKDNHLFHIYNRIARVEGTVYVLLALGVATFIAVWLR